MKCPKCESELAAVLVDEVEVDQCASCKGVWFDKRELNDVLDKQGKSVKPLLGSEESGEHDQLQGVPCPRDAQPLLRVKSCRNREVTLDCCVVCQGVWLDGGEFERIKEAEPGLRLADLL